MKKNRSTLLPFSIGFRSQEMQNEKRFSFSEFSFSLIFFFICAAVWSQSPSNSFTSNSTLLVPAGVTEMNVQAWGGGGAGGGASGGNILLSRSGAGGGAGAYAYSKITVIPGVTLNVVVAPTTTNSLSGVNAVNGAAGGNSTITGYENVIFAVGGGGGGANTTGAGPTGGKGGLDINSIGTESKISGTDGGNGYTGIIALLQISGKGGDAGGTIGGLGGSSIRSLILADSNGNDGGVPGGGGSGAMNTSAPHSGGAGASGKVIVDYICPVYSITAVSAENVCSSPGTSDVKLTGTQTGLPVGVYTVTYKLGNPASSTELTIPMTVTSAGTGRFTISGFTTSGTNRITITKLTSGGCSSNVLVNNNFADIIIYAPTVAGSVIGGSTICNGATSGTLSLSGNTGAVLNWEYSVSPFSTWTTINNTTTSYVSNPLTETTRFRAVVQNGVCALATAEFTAVTVNPLPQGSLSANGPFCETGSSQLTFTATAGAGPFTVVYKENGGTNQTKTGVISGVPFVPTTSTITASTTYTLVSVADANICSRLTGFTGVSASITVNPIPLPTFTSQPSTSVCVSTPVIYATQSGQANYVWTVPGILDTDYNILSGAISTSSNTVTLQWLTTGNKTVIVGYTSAGCPSIVNATNTIAVIKTEHGVVNGGVHICSGSPSPLLTLSTYTGTIVRWEYAETIPAVWQPITNTNDTYQPGILTTSTSYRAIVKNGTCPEDAAIETRIDVDPKPATPISGTIMQPTCVTPTGSIILTGLSATASWTITQNGTFPQTYNSSGNYFTVPNLAPGTYNFTIQENSSCPSLPTASIEIKAPATNTWNGTVWSKGSMPINTDAIVFSGDYQTTGDLQGCSCVINSGANVVVNSNHTLKITNSVTNNGGTLTFENNASLLQVNDVVNSGNIIYKRTTPLVRRYDFTYWASPVTRSPDFKLHDLSPNTLLDKYHRYDPATSSWVTILNGTEPMLPGVGYSIRAPQNYDIDVPVAFYGSFVGVPNNGPYAVSLVAAEKWSLIGNPYPSAIYADQFIADNSANIYGTLYFWTHNSSPKPTVANGVSKYNIDDYAIYNLTGSTSVGNLQGNGATTPGNQSPPLGFIAAGQSFFVQSKTGLNAIFTNSMRVPANNSQFYKSGITSKQNLERNRVWLNLTNIQGAFKQILIGYIEGATNNWDTNYDGITMDANKYLDFYSINNDLKLVIQGRALPFVDTDFVPLGYRTTIDGEFTIAIDHTDGNLSTQKIYLEDKTKGIIHDLTTSNYTFTTTIGTFLDRFVLRYTDKILGVDDFENTENKVYVSVKDKSIKVVTMEENLKEVVVFDISGKMLYIKNKVENTELQIPNLQSGNQILLVKVTLENGHITTRKIIF